MMKRTTFFNLFNKSHFRNSVQPNKLTINWDKKKNNCIFFLNVLSPSFFSNNTVTKFCPDPAVIYLIEINS